MPRMHEAEESREVLLLVRMIEDSVGPVCGPVWPPTTLSHAPPKHMNIYKNIVIMAGGTEKMRDGVQGPAGARPDEIPPPPILWGGVLMRSGGPTEAHSAFLFLQELHLREGGGHMCDSLTCYSAPEIMEWAELLLLFFRACLTCCLSSCSPSPSLCWQQLFCPRSAALCSMATIWQSSTLLQRLVPLHPTPSVR